MTRASVVPLLFLSACHWLGEADWDRWAREHGFSETGSIDTGETAPPMDPGCSAVGFDMIPLDAGAFSMGSPSGEVGHETDETRHTVTLTHDLCIGRTEVTQEQFSAVMHYEPSYFPECGSTCPVENLSWHEAAAFANAVSADAGVERCYDCTGQDRQVVCTAKRTAYQCSGYRLPTEAEWEFAARAGTDSAFTDGGNLEDGTEVSCSPDLRLGNGTLLTDLAWYCEISDKSPHPVGLLDPNGWGLYDVHGNVEEWCHDDARAYDGDTSNPLGATTSTNRVVRGGTWAAYPESLRLARRSDWDADVSTYVRGFRLARTP